MSKYFVNKVIAERKILKLVNKFTLQNNQLTGMTGYAIKAWLEKENLDNNSYLAKTLYNLGDLCHRLSDRSHEAFESLDNSVMVTINKILIELSEKLSTHQIVK